MAKVLPGLKYARDVVAGRVVTGNFVRLACERHLRDLKRYGTKKSGKKLYFDAAAAQKPIDFAAKFCCHSKGEWAGQPFILEPWEEFIVACLFGWKRRDGLRRFRNAYLEVARKNGKSTLMAFIELYLLVADGEPGAEIYCAATKRDQARIIHDEAVRMRNKSPSLTKMIQHWKSSNNLSVAATDSKFEPLGADEDTLDGLNPHGIVIDELHAHRSRRVYDVLDTATGSRRQPILVAVTTAGFDRNTVCYEEHEYGRKVLERHLDDDTVFVFIAAIDEGDSWQDESCWAKANPNLGVSVKIDDLRRKAKKAAQNPAAQNPFRRLHLNEWTEAEDRWMSLDLWDACSAPVNEDLLEGRRCYCGLDLSSNRDVSAAVFFFPPEGEGDVAQVVCRFWIPGDNIGQRVDNDGVPYNIWAEQGFMTATDGDVIDQNFIREELNEMRASFEIVELPYDPWGATKLATELGDDGFVVVPQRQNFSTLGPATVELERLVMAKAIAHGGNPVLRWMVGNVAIKQGPEQARKPDKAKSRERIDGVSALVNAIARAMVASRPGKSVYEERGILTI